MLISQQAEIDANQIRRCRELGLCLLSRGAVADLDKATFLRQSQRIPLPLKSARPMLTCLVQKRLPSFLTQCNSSGGSVYSDSILLSAGRAVTQQHPCNWSHNVPLHIMKAAPYWVTKSVAARPIWGAVVNNFLYLGQFSLCLRVWLQVSSLWQQAEREGFAMMQLPENVWQNCTQ